MTTFVGILVMLAFAAALFIFLTRSETREEERQKFRADYEKMQALEVTRHEMTKEDSALYLLEMIANEDGIHGNCHVMYCAHRKNKKREYHRGEVNTYPSKRKPRVKERLPDINPR